MPFPRRSVAPLFLVLLAWSADAAAQTAIALDTDVSAAIDDPLEVETFTVDVPVGTTIFVERVATSNLNGLNWALLDRVGRVLDEDQTALSHLGPARSMGGQVSLVVDSEAGGVGTFTFRIRVANPVETAAVIDAQINESIDVAGRVRTYRYSTAPGDLLAVDTASAIPDFSLNCILTDARGETLAPRSTELFDRAPVRSRGGDVLLTILGEANATGAYGVTLRRVVDGAFSTTVDQDASGALSIGETDVWTLDVPVSGPVFFDAVAAGNSSATLWSLLDPHGNVIFAESTSFFDQGRLDLVAGTYQVRMRAESDVASSYTFRAHTVVDESASFVPGDTVFVDVDSPGEVHRLDFVAAPNQRVMFDQIATSNSAFLNWRVLDEAGRVVVPLNLNVADSGPFVLAGGAYTLEMFSEVDATETVSFILQAPIDGGAAVAIGDAISDAITTPGEEDVFTFTAAAGQIVTLDVTATSNLAGLNLELTDAHGRAIVPRTTSLADVAGIALVGGSYSLRVVGEVTAVGTYALTLVNSGVSTFTPTGTALPFGVNQADAISVIGEIDEFTLAIADGDTVLLDLTVGTTGLVWSLFDPSGRAVFANAVANAATADRGPFVVAAGTYMVRVQHVTGTGTGAYAFTPLLIQPLVLDTVALDGTVTTAFTTRSATGRATFTVPPGGARVFIDLTDAGAVADWQLLDGAGASATGLVAATNIGTNDLGPFDLVAGDYTIHYTLDTGAAETMAFVVRSVTDESVPLTLGALVNAPLPADLQGIGATRSYTFTLATPTRLYFDTEAGAAGNSWTLLDPQGRAIFPLVRAELATDDRGPFTLVAGDYRLIIDADLDTQPAHRFRVNPVTQATAPIALDVPVADAFDPTSIGAEKSYTLAVSEGDRLFFNATAGTGARIAMIDPVGTQIFEDTLDVGADRGPFALGAGTVRFDIRTTSNGATGAFTVVRVVDVDEDVALDQLLQGTRTNPGGVVRYHFAPDSEGQPVRVDIMLQTLNMTQTLTDPVGHPLVLALAANNATTHDRGPFPLALPDPGERYTLKLEAAGDSSPSWLIKLRRPPQAPPPAACAACRSLDIVFVFDTSASMADENQAACDLAADLIAGLADAGIPTTTEFLGISDQAIIPCVTGDVISNYGDAVPGNPPPLFQSLGTCPPLGLASENYALAMAVVAANKPWSADAVRLIVPIADEGPFCGDPADADDQDASEYAADIAAQHNVVISPVLPDEVSDTIIAYAEIMSGGTGGLFTETDFDPAGLLTLVDGVAQSACSTAVDPVEPTLAEIGPPPTQVLPAGVPVLVSGRVNFSNHLRPVVDVRLGAFSASAIDRAGRFFIPVVLAPGDNVLPLEAQEECGAFPLGDVILRAETDALGGFAVLGDVTTSLRARHAGTTFHRGAGTLAATVQLENVGDFTIDGPIFYLPGPDLSAGVQLVSVDGVLPVAGDPDAPDAILGGRPYLIAVASGALAPGAVSAAVPIAFGDSARLPVRYTPQLLAPQNRAPVITSPPRTEAAVGRTFGFTVGATDPDGQALTFAVAAGPPALAVDASTGAVSWTPDALDLGAHDVLIVVADGRGGTATLRFTISVSLIANNGPPIFVSTPVVRAAVGAAYQYAAQAIDPDGDALTYSLPTAPAGMTIDANTGEVALPFSLPGAFDVTVRATDAGGAFAEQRFSLTVGDVPLNPSAPIITSTPPLLAAVDVLWSYPVVASDPDGDALDIVLELAPPGMTVTAAGVVAWEPSAADAGAHDIVIVVEDARGAATVQAFSLAVLAQAPNLAPVLLTSPGSTAVVGVPFGYTFAAFDPEALSVTYAVVSAPPGVTIDPVTGVLTWTPQAADVGTRTVALSATDGSGAIASQAFFVTVRATNAAPTVASAAPLSALVGAPYRYDVAGADSDGDVLSYALVTAPGGMLIDAVTGLIVWLPAAADEGPAPVQVQVSDLFGGTATQAFTITVVLDDTPPVVTLVQEGSTCLGQQARVCLTASDDSGVVARSATVNGSPLALDALGCAVRTSAVPATETIEGTASDASGNNGTDALVLGFIECTDATRPQVTLVSPAAGASVEGPTPIVASIDDDTPAQLTWTVSIARFGDPAAAFETIGSGTGPVDAAAVATFDTTRLANDTWRVRIEAADGAQTGGVEFQLGVAGPYKLGNFKVPFVDSIVNVGGISLSIVRSYDSFDDDVGDFGRSWRLSLSGAVEDTHPDRVGTDLVALLGAEPFTRTTRVYVTKPDGSRVGFTFSPHALGFPTGFRMSAAFAPDPGVTDTLEVVGTTAIFDYGGRFFDFLIPYNPDVFRLTTKDGVAYTLSEQEGLTDVEDSNGNTLTVDSDGVTSSLGPRVSYQRDAAGRITGITEPDDPADALPPVAHGYAYDALGNLISHTDPLGNVTRFFYTAAGRPHLLTRIEDPLGRAVVRVVYDDDGRLIATCPPSGDVNTLAGCEQLTVDGVAGTSTAIDARGNRIDRFYDAVGNTLLERRFDGVDTRDWSFTYDGAHNRLTQTDPGGATWTWTYDSKRNVTSRTDPSGTRTWTYSYSDCGDLKDECDPLGDCTTRTFDDDCNLLSETDPLGNTTTHTVDARGRVTQITDPTGEAWTFAYDARDALLTATDPRGGTVTTERDARGDVVRRTDRNGRVITSTYDEEHRLLTETWDTLPPRTITRSYDDSGRVVRSEDPDSTLVVTYTADGDIETVDNTGSGSSPALVLDYAWDGNRNLTAITDSLGTVTSYGWDVYNRLSVVSQAGGGAAPKRVELGYDDHDLPVQLARFGAATGGTAAVVTTVGYGCPGCGGQLSALVHRRGSDNALIEQVDFVRAADDEITLITDTDGAHALASDASDRLMSVDHPTGADEAFSYDSAGNRLSSSTGGAHSYGYQSVQGGHVLASTATHTFTFDDEGNTLSRTTTATNERVEYQWDHRNRLTRVTERDASNAVVRTVDLRYAPSGQLIRYDDDGDVTHLVWDGDNVHALLASDGTVRARRLSSRRIDGVLAEERGGQTQWQITDPLGSVRFVADNSGAVLRRTAYGPFGDAASTGTVPELAPGFISRESSSLGLVYLRARWYDPALGRFLSEDPLAPYRYDYANNSPHLLEDPRGETALIEYAIEACDMIDLIDDFSSAGHGVAFVLFQVANVLEGTGAADPAAALAAMGDGIGDIGEPDPPLPCLAPGGDE